MNIAGPNIFAPISPAKSQGGGKVASGGTAFALPPSPSRPSAGSPGLNDRIQERMSQRQPLASSADPAARKAPKNPEANPSAEDNANTLTRRVVWNEFLRKMNEIGVSAEDVMSAFGSLTEQELAGPPEESIGQIVAALGLSDPNAQMARQSFQDLIQKTKSSTLGEEFDSSKKQISLSMMSQRELQRKAMAQSLDHLGRDFFMQKAPSAALAQMGPLANGATPMINPEGDAASQRFANAPVDARLFADPGGMNVTLPPKLGSTLPGAPVAANVADGLAAEEKSQRGSSMDGALVAPTAGRTTGFSGANSSVGSVLPKTFDMNALSALVGGAGAASAAAVPVPVVDSSAVTAASTAAQSAASAVGSLAPSGPWMGGVGLNGGSSDEESDELPDGATALTNLGVDTQSSLAGPHKGEFQSKLETLGLNSPQAMTPQEAVQQAEIMVRDGGGEMKVTLTPDGLGEIAMKVNVHNGKVNVQMITESDEAKKMLEHSLGELKLGLTQSNLSVDSIKVDTATNLGKQMDQQYQDAQRQMAHHNLEQFRQDQQGWRRSFFDVASAKPYASQGDARRDINAPPPSSSTKRAGARRLDLVA